MRAPHRALVLAAGLIGCGARTGLALPPDERLPSDARVDVAEVELDAATDAFVDADAHVDSSDVFDGGSTDAPIVDALPDAMPDALEDVLALEAPRPIAPLSTMRTTTRRPTFRWSNAPGETSARVELCSDRACSSPIASVDATGSSARPWSDLPAGVVFWRLRATRPGAIGSAFGPTWELVVPARSAKVESASGALADFDGDGLGDVAVVVEADDGSAQLRVHSAGASAVSFAAPLGTTSEDFVWAAVDVAAAGDLDGDGFGDLVAMADGVFVFPGPPSSARPPLRIPLTLAVGDKRGVISPAGDVDGDGYGDLAFAVQGRDAAYVEVHRGGSSGVDPKATWRYDTVSGGLYTDVSGSCDFDADGFSDFVIARGLGSLVYRGGAAGPTRFTTTTAPIALRVCANDVDGDGYADFWGRGSGISGALAPFLYHGSPTGLRTPQAFSMAETTKLSSGGDFDGDGFLDLVVSSGDGSVYLSGGAALPGGFPTERLFGPVPPGFAERVAALGDLDHDGYDDAAFTGGAYVFVFRGSPTGFGASPWTPWRTIDETASAVRVGPIATSR